MKPMESNDIAQSTSQIIEDIDDTAIFDAPKKKSVNKSVETNNCLKVKQNSKLKEQDVRKLTESNITQSASQIIEDEDTAVMDPNECIKDVSFTFPIISFVITFIISVKIK